MILNRKQINHFERYHTRKQWENKRENAMGSFSRYFLARKKYTYLWYQKIRLLSCQSNFTKIFPWNKCVNLRLRCFANPDFSEETKNSTNGRSENLHEHFQRLSTAIRTAGTMRGNAHYSHYLEENIFGKSAEATKEKCFEGYEGSFGRGCWDQKMPWLYQKSWLWTT